jgi:hypothetical protein
MLIWVDADLAISIQALLDRDGSWKGEEMLH